MLLIDNVWVTDGVLERRFICDLNACRGACCVAGDEGAPLDEAEVEQLQVDLEEIKPFLTEAGRTALDEQGVSYESKEGLRTTLRNDRACAFVQFDEKGIAKCGIEQAYEAGATPFRKPISCHLYPIRVQKLSDGEALNYNEWDICDPACKLGEEMKMPVYRFLKTALIRKYGQAFYEALEEGAELNEP